MTKSTFVGSLHKNIFAGFVVSLIALPLGLSLAIASGMPPSAGIVSAIVGGIVTALLGGSYVTIAGPGYSLVVVVLSAVTTLAGTDYYQGYLLTLSAIVLAGVLMFLLGLLRMGGLAAFFPSSAIEGMMAAIGLSLIAKQFHVMLGLATLKKSSLELLVDIPAQLWHFLTTAASDTGLLIAGWLGIVSLLILLFNSYIRNSFYQRIPAPMWVLLIAIALSYYYEWTSKSSPIAADGFIALPNSIEKLVVFPDFSFSWPIISVAMTIAFVGSIESLLSIKAVDKLDVFKRRSNANRDLKALGAATAVSGALGGLNVVTVISRSSVNVTQGATNRSANFFHGAFLVLFVVVFSQTLNRIPLSALAAILVYTGFKLSHPLKFVAAYKVGFEQLFIFVVTLIATLSTNIVLGVFIGALSTLISHLLITRDPLLFFLNLFKPNVLAFKEPQEDTFFVSVKHYCTFLNFYKLQKKLDAIGYTKKVVLDFSLCKFVDHTAMEGVESYVQSYEKKGGSVEVIGLDTLGASSSHPFAVRKMSSSRGSFSKVLTRRQRQLADMAQEYLWTYSPTNVELKSPLGDFVYFATRNLNRSYNMLIDADKRCTVFDIEYSEGEFIAKEDVKSTLMLLDLNCSIPVFTLTREGLLERLYALAGYQDIQIGKHKDFNKRFHLSGPSEEKIIAFFDDALVLFFESNAIYHIESNGRQLLVFKNERLLSPSEIKALAYFGRELVSLIECNSTS
jgi:MFS superfamily sulfate permease-like transporter